MKQLKGIIPPLVTPLADQNKLDASGLENLIEHILDAGVNGLFVLGSSGEASSLPESMRNSVVQKVMAQVAGRVPVLVGISSTCLADCLATAHYAADQGAEALVMAAPYYYPISQDDLRLFTQRVAKASPLPLYIYNMPNCTKVVYQIETLERLAECETIKGVKDSGGDMVYFHRLLKLSAIRPDWSFLIGPEELLAEAVLLGGHGGVCGGANLFPQLYQSLYEAAINKDTDTILSLHNRVMDVSNAIYGDGYLSGLKYALQCRGVCSGVIAEPLHSPPEHRKRIIAEFIAEFQYPPNRPSALTDNTSKAARKISSR